MLLYKPRLTNRAVARRKRGTTLAEAPIGLWIVFVGMGFPLLILATLGLRFALYWQSARQAAQDACQAQTFYQSPNYGSGPIAPSAVQAATNASLYTLAYFPGSCTLTQPVDVYIGVTPLGSTTTSWTGSANTPLQTGTVDTDNNVYSIRVVLTGQVNPFLTFNIPFFGNVPGLTGPFPATVAEERIFENPSGLTQ